MTTIDNAFSVRIVNKVRPALYTQGDPKEARSEFWKPRLSKRGDFPRGLFHEDEIDEFKTIDYWEERISEGLGIELHDQITRRYTSLGSSEDWQNEKCELLGRVAFKAKIVSYSSLDLGFTVAGAEHLVKAFNADYDTFRIFLEGYVHPAFAEIVGVGFAAQMSYEVNASPELIAEFQKQHLANQTALPEVKNKEVVSASSPNQAPDKARFAWILANTSLLVPVVLTLLVLFFAFQEMNRARDQYNTGTIVVIEQQSKLLEEARSRLSFYETLQDSIVRDRLNLPVNPATVQITATPAPNFTPTP